MEEPAARSAQAGDRLLGVVFATFLKILEVVIELEPTGDLTLPLGLEVTAVFLERERGDGGAVE